MKRRSHLLSASDFPSPSPLSSVPGGSSKLSVDGAGRQQLPLPQPLGQLPPLLLLAHRRAGRAQVRLPQEETVSSEPVSCLCFDKQKPA